MTASTGGAGPDSGAMTDGPADGAIKSGAMTDGPADGAIKSGAMIDGSADECSSLTPETKALAAPVSSLALALVPTTAAVSVSREK